MIRGIEVRWDALPIGSRERSGSPRLRSNRGGLPHSKTVGLHNKKSAQPTDARSLAIALDYCHRYLVRLLLDKPLGSELLSTQSRPQANSLSLWHSSPRFSPTWVGRSATGDVLVRSRDPVSEPAAETPRQPQNNSPKTLRKLPKTLRKPSENSTIAPRFPPPLRLPKPSSSRSAAHRHCGKNPSPKASQFRRG